MSRLIRMFHNDESGQDLIEYALISLSIAAGTVSAFTTIGTNVTKQINDFSAALSTL